MADLIVVLDGVRVVEVGSHQELMATAGQNAELCEAQASAHRQGTRPATAYSVLVELLQSDDRALSTGLCIGPQ